MTNSKTTNEMYILKKKWKIIYEKTLVILVKKIKNKKN